MVFTKVFTRKKVVDSHFVGKIEASILMLDSLVSKFFIISREALENYELEYPQKTNNRCTLFAIFNRLWKN